MKKILKRILLIIGFIPVSMIYGGIKWIITGEDFEIITEKFIDWCIK